MKKLLRRKEKERNSRYTEVKSTVDPSNYKKNSFLLCYPPVKTVGFLLLIAIVGLISYSNSFIVPFQFDDLHNIAENPVVHDLDNFTSSLSGYNYNPRRVVGYFTLALNYHVGGTDVTGYHIVNLIIHLINSLLVYFLVVLTFRTPYFRTVESGGEQSCFGRFIALFTALLFVVHPVQTQAVTYIVQRFTSLATLFYLLSVVLYVWGRITGVERSGGRAVILYVLSVLSAVLAMKTKEIAFTLPLAVVLYEWIFFQVPWRKRVLVLLPVLLTLIIVPLSVMGTDKPLGEVLSDLSEKSRIQTDIPRWDYLVTQMRVITTYIRLIFLPVNQNLDYDYPVYRSLFDPPVLMSFLFLVVIAGFGVYMLYVSRGDKGEDGSFLSEALPFYRLAGFGILWFFLALMVESSVIPIVDVIYEHRVYLPSVGAFLALSTGAYVISERSRRRWPKADRAFLSSCAVIVIALSTATYARNTIWQDGIRLWEDVIKKSPFKSRGYNDLGYLHLTKGSLDRAIEYFQISIQLRPSNADAHNNLGVAFYSKGLIDRAVKEFEIALRLSRSPRYAASAHHNLGIAYTRKGLLDEALTELEAALKLDPDNPEIYNDFGVAHKGKGLIDKAIELYKIALRLKPDYAIAHMNLGVAYDLKGLRDKANEHFNRAHDLEPDKY